MKTPSERSGRARLRFSGFFGQPGNVMFLLFYDIVAEVIAAQRSAASALLVAFGKCHERCGCVTFREIYKGCSTPESGHSVDLNEVLIRQRPARKLSEFAADRERSKIDADETDPVDEGRHFRLRRVVVA